MARMNSGTTLVWFPPWHELSNNPLRLGEAVEPPARQADSRPGVQTGKHSANPAGPLPFTESLPLRSSEPS